jgi:hypothetical protein
MNKKVHLQTTILLYVPRLGKIPSSILRDDRQLSWKPSAALIALRRVTLLVVGFGWKGSSKWMIVGLEA